MEGSKKVGSASSNVSELFGPKNGSSSSPSSAEVVASMIKTPLGSGLQTIRSEWVGWKQDHTETETLNTEPENTFKSGEGERRNAPAMDYYHRRVRPSNLCSSIFYGGQDLYDEPDYYSTNSVYKKDATDEYPDMAERGNWWLGSLYY